DALAEHLGGLQNHPANLGITGAERIDQRLFVGHLWYARVCRLDHRRHARHGLETSDSPATAELSIRGLRLAAKDRVADFAGTRTITLVQLATQDDPGTDSPPYANDDQALRPRSGPVRAFSNCGRL